jgi:hypothetical protein
MSDIHQRELKMQERRKQTSFRDFVKEITSRCVFNLYKNHDLVSKFPVSPKIQNILSHNAFNALGDQMDIAEYDDSLGLLENIQRLRSVFQHEQTTHFYKDENADFADCVFGGKNAYLSFVVGEFDTVLYSAFAYAKVSNIFSSVFVTNTTDNVYQSKCIEQSFNIFYSKYLSNCANCRFCTNCIGCSECLFSDNLENQSYCIYGKPYPKAEYLEKKKELLQQKENFSLRYSQLNNIGNNYGSKNVE